MENINESLIFSKTRRRTWKYLQELPRSLVQTGAKKEETKQNRGERCQQQQIPKSIKGRAGHICTDRFLKDTGPVQAKAVTLTCKGGSETGAGWREKSSHPRGSDFCGTCKERTSALCFLTISTFGPFFWSVANIKLTSFNWTLHLQIALLEALTPIKG